MRRKDNTIGTAICNLADQVREVTRTSDEQAALLRMLDYAFANPFAMKGMYMAVQAVSIVHNESAFEIIQQVRNNLAMMAEAIEAINGEEAQP